MDSTLGSYAVSAYCTTAVQNRWAYDLGRAAEESGVVVESAGNGDGDADFYWLFKDVDSANMVACALHYLGAQVWMQNLALFNLEQSIARGMAL